MLLEAMASHEWLATLIPGHGKYGKMQLIPGHVGISPAVWPSHCPWNLPWCLGLKGLKLSLSKIVYKTPFKIAWSTLRSPKLGTQVSALCSMMLKNPGSIKNRQKSNLGKDSVISTRVSMELPCCPGDELCSMHNVKTIQYSWNHSTCGLVWFWFRLRLAFICLHGIWQRLYSYKQEKQFLTKRTTGTCCETHTFFQSLFPWKEKHGYSTPNHKSYPKAAQMI